MDGAGYAETHDVERFAGGLPEHFLECRTVGHHWKPWTASRRAWGFDQSLRCLRCGTEMVQTLDKSGRKVSGHYVYPDGYLAQGLGRIVREGKDVLRLETVERQIGKRKVRVNRPTLVKDSVG